MPFKSNKQRRYLWANEPEIARDWTDRYGARGGGIMRVPLANGLTPEELTASLSGDAIDVTEGKYITTTPGNYKTIPHNYYETSYTAAGAPVFDITKTGDPALNPASKMVQGEDPYGTVSEAEANNPNFKYLDQLKKDFKDPIKKTLATILPGGDPGYVKGGLYNKIFEGLGSAKEYGETKLKNIGSTIGKPVLGLASMIGKMVDKFDKLPEADQMYISQQMGGAGQMGEGIYRDPQSGALRDKGGLNVRSARGNYAEAVYKEANRYAKALERTKKAHLDKYGSLDTKSKYGKTWAEMNKRNLEMFRYYNDKKIKQKKFVSNYLQSPKVQKQKADEIIAKEKAKKTGHAEAQATGGDYHSGHQSTVGGQTTDWGPMSHMIARGGLAQRAPRGSYFNGGLASLWRR